MRKTSTYARKRAHTTPPKGAAVLMQTMVRALPHTESLEFGNLRIEAGPSAERAKTEVCGALDRLQAGTGSIKDFDDLAHEIAIVGIRSWEIGGTDDARANLKKIFDDACAALDACRKRYLRWQKFELLRTESAALQDGIDAWEVIFDASSPEQMHSASATYVRWSKLSKRKAA